MPDPIRRDLAERLLRLARGLAPRSRPKAWLAVLAGGVGAYGLVNGLLLGTPRLSLVPVSLLLGSFLVPFVAVLFLEESAGAGDLPPAAPSATFLAGGLLGLLGAHFLTPVLGRLPLAQVLVIGLSEEVAKLLPLGFALLVPGVRAAPREARVGLVLGAASGLGFAAFESMGIAFTQLIQSGFSKTLMDQILMVRSFFGPLAHGTWTATVGAALWEWRGRGDGRAAGRAALALAAVVALHALWNVPRLVPDERFRSLVRLTVPYLDLPLWHLAAGALSLLTLYAFVRGRLGLPSPPGPEDVRRELEDLRALAASLGQEDDGGE